MPPEAHETAVAGIAPEVAAGYARLRDSLQRDGALTGSLKALITATCASVLGHEALAARELARGRRSGLTEREVGIAGVALLLARGEAQADRFIALAGGLCATESPRPVDTRDAEEYFLHYLGVGELPARMAIMRRLVPDVFEAYHRMHHGVLAADPTATRTSELVLVAVNAAQLQTRFVAVHAVTARAAGATDAELAEAVAAAIPVAGVAAWAAGAEALFQG